MNIYKLALIIFSVTVVFNFCTNLKTKKTNTENKVSLSDKTQDDIVIKDGHEMIVFHNKAINYKTLQHSAKCSHPHCDLYDRYQYKKVISEDSITRAYIKRFSRVAIDEMHKFGIPASIHLAQAIMESKSGEGNIAMMNNNHFGMKCFSKTCKKGHCSNMFENHHKDFYRKYDNSWESWRSHSKMLISGRYKKLLSHGNNYEQWAEGLQQLNYVLDKNYSNKLLTIIDEYSLYELDRY